jgi:hypothetical protein
MGRGAARTGLLTWGKLIILKDDSAFMVGGIFHIIFV